MKKLIITILSGLLALPVYAAPTKVDSNRPLEEYIASATSNSFNRFKNVDGFLNALSNYTSKEDIRSLEKQLAKLGVDRDTKLPAARFEKDKVTFSSGDVMRVINAEKISINHKVYHKTNKSYSETFRLICEKEACNPQAGIMDLFAPKAHAGIGKWFAGLLGSAALGWGLGKVVGVGRIGGALMGVAAFLLGSEFDNYFGILGPKAGIFKCAAQQVNHSPYYNSGARHHTAYSWQSRQPISPFMHNNARNGRIPPHVANHAGFNQHCPNQQGAVNRPEMTTPPPGAVRRRIPIVR